MENLLRWGIENSAQNAGGDAPAPAPRSDLDPAIIDQILGKPDAELMREALAVALDDGQSEKARVTALDDFEMLIENIDNANNMEKLKMWEPIHGLVRSDSASPTIRTQAVWAVGTALQNNPAAQSAYLAYDPLPALLQTLSSAETGSLRSKAVYAISGLTKHSAAAVKRLDECGGWDVLRASLEDSDITVRRKVSFLLNALITPTSPPSSPTRESSTNVHTPATAPRTAPVHPNSHAAALSDPSSTSTWRLTLNAAKKHGIVDTMVRAVVQPTPFGADGEGEGDPAFEEACIRFLHTYAVVCHGALAPDAKAGLLTLLQGGNAEELCERWSLARSELGELQAILQ